ncbi:hypothetical protein [Clostridium sp. MD294]|uniref:hypothetical protein n=1 Tax=Clostridium sp. MD294 TaxID=97138 RepID=UPI0012EA0584|nr:hypothetical protein [Clostridium sp. MD294]NDO47549.1 hypothetical protein [Clostridium sp. MD294]
MIKEIKVSFYSTNADDVEIMLMSNITNQMEVEEWIIQKIPSLHFTGCNYPHDLESFYDIYFNSDIEEECDANNIYYLLKQNIKYSKDIKFSVSIVDDKCNFIKEIGNNNK